MTAEQLKNQQLQQSVTKIQSLNLPKWIENKWTSAEKEKYAVTPLEHAEHREDTAIQRQVADLKAAGLNPILATNYGGASSAAAVKYVDSPATTSIASSAEKNANANLINSVANLFSSAIKLAKK